jgi:ADP-ribose pyrophosphatase YjhB (NUDIX family)/O-acetyl-ADP-ribose deacetylase (regulator of RNase III)
MGGGVAGAIKKKGGREIEDEAIKLGPINIGKAVATQAGKLPAKYVIHAATMGMDFQTDEIKIRSSARSALEVAEQLGITSIAFPALGCGVGGFAPLAAAKIISQEVFRHLREREKSSLREVIFCLYDRQTFRVFQEGVLSYLEHIAHKLQGGPFVTVDVIIEFEAGVVLIQRSNPPFGWALPGGFVDYGESLEQAVRREAKEETGLELSELRQFHTYSAPGRDPRFHTVDTVFIAQGKGLAQAGDDAAGIRIVKLTEIPAIDFAFDHKEILQDYLRHKKI